MLTPRRALVREVNPHLICVLCSGYFIEATTIIECLHSFCRSCLVKYLENSKFCPICDVQLHKNNPLLSVRCDQTLQQLVYKLIPGLYGKEMARRRKYYSELGGGPSSDPEGAEFPIGDAYFSPEDLISLSLEFISGIPKDDETGGSESEEMSVEKQGVHHRRYLQCPAAVTMSHLQKFLRMKYGLNHDLKVDIIYAGEVLTEDFSLMDVAYTFNWNRATPMRFKFRLLQKSSMIQEVAAKEVELPLKGQNSDSSKIEPKTVPQTKPFSLTLQKLNPVVGGSVGVKNTTKEPTPKTKATKRCSDKPVEKSKEAAPEPEPKKIKIVEPLTIARKEKRMPEKIRAVEPVKPVVEEEEPDYADDIQEVEEEDEYRLRISPDEDMSIDNCETKEPEPVPPAPEPNPDPEPEPMQVEVEEEVERYRYSRSEEKRREKKKNKKAKHHHHHRHHDRRRDSPPAATILHSPENDIMKLKIKLTDINTRPKYSVVDGNEERREINGNSPRHIDKYSEKESKSKSKDEETKKNKTEPIKPMMELTKDKGNQMRVRPPSKTVKSPPPVSKSPVPAAKPTTPSPKESPVHKMCPSPKPITLPRQNGVSKNDQMKLPPSSITVSKITAAEKEKMEQQKLMMNRANNNGLESKRPSLEIMLVNAPKKANSEINDINSTKPLEVKKVMRPTPPSIPLSRLGKGLFGPKGSPPPLVLASKTSQDETGVLDLSGKSSRKSPEEATLRSLVDHRGLHPQDQLRIPIPPVMTNKLTGYQHSTLQQRTTIKPGPNQTVRQIPNPSALLFRQQQLQQQHHGLLNGGRSHVPPPMAPLRKMESMTKNIEKVAAGLTIKAAVEAGYASK